MFELCKIIIGVTAYLRSKLESRNYWLNWNNFILIDLYNLDFVCTYVFYLIKIDGHQMR